MLVLSPSCYSPTFSEERKAEGIPECPSHGLANGGFGSAGPLAPAEQERTPSAAGSPHTTSHLKCHVCYLV